ncbi:MAG: type IV toxin-antitoxin system AbiEi family antitoxin domain-containing protein [Lachnospiraceae bacterium]|nr:type IV toxin-antitoxin system AbiEi family antitoxin domain-containing protein [Lachnospiraceae bacterium]
MRITTYYRLEDLYKKYRGYISTKELLEEGFSNRQIATLTEENYLEKVCHGYYWMLQCGYEKPYDYKCIEVCLSDPRAVIAMKSACYYQGFIKSEPDILIVATERTDRSVINMKFPVERHYFSGGNFQYGMKRVETEFGSYNIYNIERSFCDMVRLNDEFMIEISNQLKVGTEQYERLLGYAERLKLNKRF